MFSFFDPFSFLFLACTSVAFLQTNSYVYIDPAQRWFTVIFVCISSVLLISRYNSFTGIHTLFDNGKYLVSRLNWRLLLKIINYLKATRTYIIISIVKRVKWNGNDSSFQIIIFYLITTLLPDALMIGHQRCSDLTNLKKKKNLISKPSFFFSFRERATSGWSLSLYN